MKYVFTTFVSDSGIRSGALSFAPSLVSALPARAGLLLGLLLALPAQK